MGEAEKAAAAIGLWDRGDLSSDLADAARQAQTVTTRPEASNGR